MNLKESVEEMFRIKKEQEENQLTSEMAALAALYADHEIKPDLVLGPVLIQPQVFPASIDIKQEYPSGIEQLQPSDGAPVQDIAVPQAPPSPGTKNPPQKILESNSTCYVKLQRIKLLPCDICDKVFEKRSALVTHFIDQHAGDDEESDNENFEPDLSTNEPASPNQLKLYPCNICHEQFAYKSNMVIHKLRHRGKEPLTCDICKKDFAWKCQLLSHISSHYSKQCYSCDVSINRCKDRRETHTMINTLKNVNNRDSCGEKAKQSSEDLRLYAGSRQQHRELHNKVYTVKTKFETRVQHHTCEKTFSCKLCEKRFRLKAHLKDHVQSHTGQKPFSCEFCKKQFALKSNLNSHVKIHTGDKPHQCEICDKRFYRHTSLVYHKNIHTEERYSCDTCKKQFAQKQNLIQHVKIHTIKKRYACGICKTSFTVKSEFTSHNKMHTQQNYACGICEKLFLKRKNLIAHIKQHTDKKSNLCEICDAAFWTKSHLNRHLKIHTGQKPHTCDVCKKSFVRKCDLTGHYRTHTGEKPFMCNVCKMSFSHNCNLKKHARIIHG